MLLIAILNRQEDVKILERIIMIIIVGPDITTDGDKSPKKIEKEKGNLEKKTSLDL